jgi:nuclear transport factor 2 (NTF2) superfamily protein
MSYLKRSEQIRIESVRQLEQVYEVLKGQWDKDYPIYEEIDTFNGSESMKYVYWYNDKVALFMQEYDFETITFDQFMSRLTPPLSFWKWAEQNGPGRVSNEMVEEYVRYRLELGR